MLQIISHSLLPSFLDFLLLVWIVFKLSDTYTHAHTHKVWDFTLDVHYKFDSVIIVSL